MSWFVPGFWGSMLGTQHLEDAVIKAAQKQGMSVLLCSDGKRQAEAVHSVCGSGRSYCLKEHKTRGWSDVFLQKNAQQHASTCHDFFVFDLFFVGKPIFENLWPQIEGCDLTLSVCAGCDLKLCLLWWGCWWSDSWRAVQGRTLRKLGLRFWARCAFGRLEMSIFHLGNRWTMCLLIGSCQRLAWWFVMVVLGQPFVPLEQVPLRLKFIHLALSSKRVEFSFNWHTRIWELSSYPRCTPRGHTRYPETMIINHNYINYILSSKKFGVWSSVESLFWVILITWSPVDFHEVCQWWYVPWSHPSLLTKCCMLNGWNGSILDLGFNPWSPV